MSKNIYSVINGTGNYIPGRIISNKGFISNDFFDASGEKLEKSSDEIIKKFQ